MFWFGNIVLHEKIAIEYKWLLKITISNLETQVLDGLELSEHSTS